MRARARPRLRPRTRAAPARALRKSVAALSRAVPSESREPALRPSSPAVLRAEPSARRLRRDVRRGHRVAQQRLAEALRGLAGAAEARIRRGTARAAARPETDPSQQTPARFTAEARHDAPRVLRRQARALSGQLSRHLRPRSAAALLRRSETSPARAGFALSAAQQHGDPQTGRQLDR